MGLPPLCATLLENLLTYEEDEKTEGNRLPSIMASGPALAWRSSNRYFPEAENLLDFILGVMLAS